jgi:hypothetical protein
MTTRIATTILNQMGGNRLIAMTGAKHFVALESGVRSFIASRGKLAKEMKISYVFKETKGAFGAEQFKAFFEGE